jgi:hypothetical protein
MNFTGQDTAKELRRIAFAVWIIAIVVSLTFIAGAATVITLLAQAHSAATACGGLPPGMSCH